jgi:phosphate starvation-inducible PhoH-like protein
MNDKKRSRKKLNEEEDIETWTEDRLKQQTAKVLSNKIEIKCRSALQKSVVASIEQKVISIITGPPGTGKTYLSCAKALQFIKEEGDIYKKIILIKSVNAAKDEEIGYLKGTLQEKMEYYMYPFMSNFYKVIGKAATEQLKANGLIEILPIKFALGVTLDDSIIIIDEAQQISKDHLRTLLTRIGNNSKMIFLGDIKQKSVNKSKKSALEILIEHFSHVKEIGIVKLGKNDIVRHPIIKKIEDVFDKIEEQENLNGN